MISIFNKKITKIYLGQVLLEDDSDKFLVQYHVDQGDIRQSVVSKGTNLLNLLTPTKSGWTFVGWREDSTASSSVLSSKIMGDEPITLYAVFKQDVTVTFYDSNSTPVPWYRTRYYNAYGNTSNPTITATQTTLSGWTARGWAINAAGNATIAYANGAEITVTDNITLYGCYEQTVTQEFRSNYSVQKVDGKRYYNSYGNTVNASVTAPNGASMSGWSWRGWASAGVTSGNANVAYANGATIGGLTSSNVYYGLYQQTIYLYYNGNGSASGSVSTQSGTRYYSEGSGNSGTVNPSFKLASNGYSRSGYTFTGWNLGAVGATITLSSNTTAYAQWVANPFYAIQNGVVNRTYAPNASAWADGYSRSSGTIDYDGTTYYGGHGHPNDDGQNWGADTGNITTNGLKKLYIQPYMNNWSFGSPGYLTVYGNGAVIYSAEINRQAINSWSTTLDIANYNNIRVYINSPNDEDIWVNCGLITVYLHN